VARGGGAVIVRVIGTGNMLNAPALAEFADIQRAQGYRRFVFDLAECRGLDSTFMGSIVGLVHALRRASAAAAHPNAATPEAPGRSEPEMLSPQEALALLKAQLARTSPDSRPAAPGDASVVAVNVSRECRELLAILGVDRFIPILGTLEVPGLEMTILPEKEMSREQRRQMILQAHGNLVEMDKRNEARFGAFLKTLSSELAKAK
jgi:hypothetical protein